jgi:hypothetical protein
MCYNNLIGTEIVAAVLLKGIQKSNYENIQPFLDVIQVYLKIKDKHQ